jgi:tetratricopeptide (TPR) repeat protein
METATGAGGAGGVDKVRRLAEAVGLREAGELEAARKQLLSLAHDFPDDGVVAYQTAWIHDRLGLERDAAPYYERALASGYLDSADRLGALVSYGSTLRVLGRHQEAVDVLRAAAGEYPEDGGARAFLAMALYNTGEHHEAMSVLLRLLAATSTDVSVASYRKAIEYYAADLDATEEQPRQAALPE